ncbi:hypothetical protein COV88_03170 [Candidatus Saccharibacteria bacterium CG11_big_fil_rev_8_21_14_0_20_41_19]|nr:hypothetical protein [Candidatus Saccharibacteria bacterium]OIP85565.1 MAG: hypothetical protein AUK57_03630 [Candidatus Saccharibacteria bacterium CG2_30_41_52]PIQ70728.1 MAG: hypothetical protein COV88_03170 [Candidatus Saccharibacteria bacterium CG11_big_fil_rev_8_21_14_0_20_41_19]PIZ59309.1 MAG: hypothetical protein COY18_03890 [Candidatus Saccharibacteria bacterium CG_4_10_14_0_2_um_filter_41_11]PJC29821.1 MAG: hypothetical protein CO052_01425 [Candidatus Saccharibacteria bacterium CG_4
MKNIKNWIVSLAIVATAGGALFAIAAPQTVFAAEKSDCNQDSVFLGFPTWYRGLTSGAPKCEITMDKGLSVFIWTIILNVLDIALMIVGYLSVGYIIYGGFLLMTGRGKPAEIAEGQITIRNAVVGLAISFGSVAVVNFIAGGITNNSGAFGLPSGTATEITASVLGMVYTAAGIIAVITIIIGGYMYTISGGSPGEVEKSKNTILYAVIGLIVIIGAFVITQFVLGRF